MNRHEIVEATAWTMISEGQDRIEKALQKLEEKMDKHIDDSRPLYERVAVLEARQVTMSRIVWGAVSAAGLGFIAAVWGLINKSGI